MAEHFRQLVVEDRFIAGRPAWENAGVQMVDDVTPYENAKIRMLNATHIGSALYGSIRNTKFMHEAIAQNAIRSTAEKFIREDAIPTLRQSVVPLPAYARHILIRFANPHIDDTVERVASESYAKLASYLLPTLRDLRVDGKPYEATATFSALHFLYLRRHFFAKYDRNLSMVFRETAISRHDLDTLFESRGPVETYCADFRHFGELAGKRDIKDAVRRTGRAFARPVPKLSGSPAIRRRLEDPA